MTNYCNLYSGVQRWLLLYWYYKQFRKEVVEHNTGFNIGCYKRYHAEPVEALLLAFD